jgi:DNA repair exonuclease SbcCD nuclease subunit
VVISGNHDTPRVCGTGSPYDALERAFPLLTFAWRLEAVTAQVAGVSVHAVPQTLSVDALRVQLERAAEAVRADTHNLLIAHVALTSLPVRSYRDINELEIEEAAFARAFDSVVLVHYHSFQKVSKRTWYAGSSDTFSFADTPEQPKGVLVLDTDAGKASLVANPNTRQLLTVGIQAAGMSPGELVDAVGRAGEPTPHGAILRIFLDGVDAAAYRQVSLESFQEAVPAAIHVQVEVDAAAPAGAVQGAAAIGGLESEWLTFVERQDVAGVDRERVTALGHRLLAEARGETA